MKKILLVLTCIVAMAMMIVGCGGSDKKDAVKGNDKKITVGFSVSTQNNPFFVSLAKGVEAKAKELGVTVKVVDAQNDPAKQANDIADLLQQNISVLLVNPVDSDAISTSVKAANKAKIPVICLDRSANQGDVACLVASDNVKGGEMAADYIIKKLGEKVKVAELEGIPGASASRERGEGFHKLADSKLTVVAKQTAEFDRSKGGQLARLIGTLCIHAVLIFPIRAIEAATAAILRRVRPAAVVMIKTGLFLHQPFKGPILAGSKAHNVAPFLNLGMKNGRPFLNAHRYNMEFWYVK